MLAHRWFTGALIGAALALGVWSCSQTISGPSFEPGAFAPVALAMDEWETELTEADALAKPGKKLQAELSAAIDQWEDAVTTVEVGSGEFGPEGGVLLIPHRKLGIARLIIPAGALDEPADIWLKFRRGRRAVIEVGTHGLQFNVPVTLEIPTDHLRGRKLQKLLKLVIAYFNETTEEWELVPFSGYDPDDQVVRAELDHFSRYGIGSVP